MLILGLNQTTLLDYPGRVAATVFTGGCNFRCPFCHNAGLVLEPALQKELKEEEVLSYLKKRKNLLKGVCITGGEPTLQADLPDFLSRIKELGYAVKLDTNGYCPKVIKTLAGNGLIDYVAMDIKNSLEKYPMTAGKEQMNTGSIQETAAFLMESGIEYEFRTTLVKELHTKEDLLKIADWIKGCPVYFLQQFQDNENVIGTGFHGYTEQEMKDFAALLNSFPGMEGKVKLRGVG